MPMAVISVRQLNLYIKSIIEADSRLAYISIRGEISNFKSHFSSGHLYFALKDESSTVKCVMFKGNASRVNFPLKDGMKVICSGQISVFERDGVYQLYAENIFPDGEGDLLAELEKTKARLEDEGLFDTSRKKPLPKFPKKVCIITSETGAAVQDIFNILTRRYPLCDILLIPAIVQGESAPKSLINALDMASDTDSDVIIIGRGGGSAEDLWCFNDESLARKISQAQIPIISAVGHETDFTICDFVADLRAPTPSAAAELAVPDINELKGNITNFEQIISKRVSQIVTLNSQKFYKLISSNIFTDPAEKIVGKRYLMLESVRDRIEGLAAKAVMTRQADFSGLAARFDELSPVKTLLRGYAVVEKNNKAIVSVREIDAGEKLTINFSDGTADCIIESVREEER